MTTFEGPPLDHATGIGARTFGAFVEQLAERHGSSEAIAFDDPLRGGLTVRWSYVDLRDAARGVALGLLATGFLPVVEGKVDASIFANYQRQNMGFGVRGFNDAGALAPVQGIFHYATFGLRFPSRSRRLP